MAGNAGIAKRGKDFIRITWFTKVRVGRTIYAICSACVFAAIGSIMTGF
jgi:hypothetical protein